MPQVNVKTMIIFGSGFSVGLGLPTTEDIENIIKILLDLDQPSNKPTKIKARLERLKKNKSIKFDNTADEDFRNTLNLLFDGDGAKTAEEADKNYNNALNLYKETYRKKFPGSHEKEGALDLHLNYNCMRL